jgi:hypothetical protein
MGAYKQFLASDIVITPLEVNKSFTFEGAAALTSSVVGIDRYLGTNIDSYIFNPNTDPTTGEISTQYQRLVFDSIQQLYYSNYLNSTASYGSPVVTSSIFPGANSAGDVLVGTTSSAGRYYNYPQTTLTFAHYFPTESNAEIGVLSIPTGIFGNYIQPNSFLWKSESGSIVDDGQGNLIYSASQQIIGNIFYGHGLAIITNNTVGGGSSLYGSAIYGVSLYGGAPNYHTIENFVNSPNVTCSFSSSLTIYETQYKCTAKQYEFSFSQNPTITSGSTTNSSSIGTFYNPAQYLYPFATGSYFRPYVTTIGLYNEQQQLLAIGKLSQPLPLSPTTDTTILINIDR